MALVARDVKRLESVRDAIGQRGGTAAVFAGDVTREEDVAAVARAVKERFGHRANPDQQCGNKLPQGPGRLFSGGVSRRGGLQSDLYFSHEPRLCSGDEGQRVRPRYQYGVHHGPISLPGAHPILRPKLRCLGLRDRSRWNSLRKELR